MTDVFLHPGEFRFAETGTVLATLLGSCVAVSLWHPGRRIGGLCHFMLPGRSGDWPQAAARPDGRFAEDAFALFGRELARTGTRPPQYHAKIFGGAAQLLADGVAAANVRAGLALLERHGFTLAARDVGGTGARVLRFDLATGDVWVRRAGRLDLGVAS
ncbi:chemotaxis protein CheD [Dactylosporangium sp. CA-139066]|uniref:chemotaxis protein CheD n=1 Tax=Dactylosporangium sp. CA-139066 TaxID=3239930 RepID=UPI003D8FE0AB